MEQIPPLRRYARALVFDVERADDLVQDCLERAWSRQHLWQEGSDLRAWLFTIMHNLYANSVRRYSKEPVLTLFDEARDAAGEESSPMLLSELERGLATLSAEQREVLLMAGLEEISYEEMAKVLDIPIGTVMSRLHRGRERLREFMANEEKIGK